MASSSSFTPASSFTNPLLTDLYQITMGYAYFVGERHKEPAVFDLFFRKHPFKGEFTVFAGLDEALRFIDSFTFTESDIAYLRDALPSLSEAYLTWLSELDTSEVEVLALNEGAVAMPLAPLLRLKGPLAVCQLLETPLLNIINYASLMATNAARFVQAAGPGAYLLEFGLRRAQGPDGGMSASRYSYVGGFHGTSNVLAGKKFGIPIKGTHAHSFVCSFVSLDDVPDTTLALADGSGSVDLADAAATAFTDMGLDRGLTNPGEFAAFIAYAVAFPDAFLALVDTYDTIASGVVNFLAVSLALARAGYTPRGIRLDSGDLAALSIEARNKFNAAADAIQNTDPAAAETLRGLNIVASDGINEALLHKVSAAGHEINTFGIGTNLVTCQAQPALGCVFKLVSVNGTPRIKLSQNISKVTIPGEKLVYRLFDADGSPIIDVLTLASDKAPAPGEPFIVRHPQDPIKRVKIIPHAVESLLVPVYADNAVVPTKTYSDDLKTSINLARDNCVAQQAIFAEQTRVHDPVPYRMYMSNSLYAFFHELWLQETAIPTEDGTVPHASG